MTGLRATPPFEPEQIARIRRRAVEAGKWDPQVHDGPALAPFALRLPAAEWSHLLITAEAMWRELAALEPALLARPDLLRTLGLPRAVRRAIATTNPAPPAINPVRFARFDFHPTPTGWRVSEINADVPGGFLEAGPITQIVADELPEPLAPANDAAAALADALAHHASRGTTIALVHATAFTDDLQVMELFRRLLAERGVRAACCAPDHLTWLPAGGCITTRGNERVSAILRFFPAEWLPNLGRRADWRRFFHSLPGDPVLANPASALAIQSKRLNLALDMLNAEAPAWRVAVPETRSPFPTIYSNHPIPNGWLLKPAMGRVGEGVTIPGVTAQHATSVAIRSARLSPRAWALQRRFDSLAITVDSGPRHVCIGVYVINGRAIGSYTRVAARPLIDAHAQDAALLIDDIASPATPMRSARERNLVALPAVL
jgi:glutathionylspermidine synthase